jgi:hypothetical protein
LSPIEINLCRNCNRCEIDTNGDFTQEFSFYCKRLEVVKANPVSGEVYTKKTSCADARDHYENGECWEARPKQPTIWQTIARWFR